MKTMNFLKIFFEEFLNEFSDKSLKTVSMVFFGNPFLNESFSQIIFKGNSKKFLKKVMEEFLKQTMQKIF